MFATLPETTRANRLASRREAHATATISAYVGRLLCVTAVALSLWSPQGQDQSNSAAHYVAAGFVGVMTALILLMTPATESGRTLEWMEIASKVFPGGWGPDTAIESASQEQSLRPLRRAIVYAAGPALLLLGAVLAIALTGGQASQLSLLLLLPALVLDTRAGERSVPLLATTVWLAAFTVGLGVGAPTGTSDRSFTNVTMPTTWAISSALILWVRVLLAERCMAARTVHLAAASWQAETIALRRARGELLAHVSHELLTPLAAIQTGAGLLGHPVPSHEPVRPTMAEGVGEHDSDMSWRVARNVQRNAIRLTLLVEDMLQLARIEEARMPLHLAWHACADTIRNATEGIALLCESRNQHVEWAAMPARLTYWGDARRIDQVLINLLANAHKYAGDGATISVSAQEWQGGVRWEVADDGPHVSDQALSYLFERYYRAAHQETQGNGLGLTIADALVAMHSGRIWAENNDGPGCQFVFWLPDPEVARVDTPMEWETLEGDVE